MHDLQTIQRLNREATEQSRKFWLDNNGRPHEIELPVVELPVVELPVVELPVVELPVVELPVVKQTPDELDAFWDGHEVGFEQGYKKGYKEGERAMLLNTMNQ